MNVQMETNPKYQEIIRLSELLDKQEIPYTMRKAYAGWVIEYRWGKHIVGLAIQHDRTLGHEYDLIEVRGFGLGEEKDGFLKVVDAFGYFADAYWLRHLRKRKKPTIE